jgi:hypothetical protein
MTPPPGVKLANTSPGSPDKMAIWQRRASFIPSTRLDESIAIGIMGNTDRKIRSPVKLTW